MFILRGSWSHPGSWSCQNHFDTYFGGWILLAFQLTVFVVSARESPEQSGWHGVCSFQYA